MHFRNIRAVMNQARKTNVIKDSQYPFGKDKFEIKTGEARKKALAISQIKSIYLEKLNEVVSTPIRSMLETAEKVQFYRFHPLCRLCERGKT